MDQTESEYDKEKFSERLAKLTGGVAIIRVGAATEADMKQKKGRVEDALHATRAAVAEGILPGGGVALIRAIAAVEELAEKLKGDEKAGAEIVARALEKPIRTIAENSGQDGAVVADEVRSAARRTPNIGYNANTGEYVDMFKAGIVDPTKVTRSRPAERRQHRRPDAHDRGDGHQDRRGRARGTRWPARSANVSGAVAECVSGEW